MNKKIKISLVIIILIAIAAFLIVKNIDQKEKNYTLTKVNNYNYFILKQNNKYGVIGTNGNTIIDPVYDEVRIPNPEKGVFICYKDNTPICLNENNAPIFTEYENVEPIRLKNTVSDLMYEKSTMTYLKDDKMGLLSIDGKKILDNKYESIETLPSQEGKLLVKKQGKVGIININGYEIVKPEYDQIQVDGYYDEENKKSGYITSNTTKEGYRYGYINYNGEEILKPEYNALSRILEIKDPNNAYLILAKDGKYGVYKNGDILIKNDYQSINYDNENQVFVVEQSGTFGVTDLKGNMIVPLEYQQIDITGIGIYASKDDKITVYDKNGKYLDIDQSISMLNTDNENYKIEIKSAEGSISYGILDNNNQEVVPSEYSYIEYLEDNYFIASNKEGKLGVIDSSNNAILPLEYSSIHKVEGTNITQASKDDKRIDEFYSSKLEKVCETPTATVTVEGNYIHIKTEENTKYINVTSEEEVPNTEVYANNTLFSSNNNGYWGFADKEGNVKVDYKYEKVTEFNKYGYAGIKENGMWGVINSQGEIVLEPTYSLNQEIERTVDFIGKYYSVEYGFGEIYYTSDAI